MITRIDEMFALLKVHKITAHLGREYDFHPMLTGLTIRRRMFRAEEAVLLKQFLGGSIVESRETTEQLAA